MLEVKPLRSREEDPIEAVIEVTLRSVWAFRTELLLAGASGALWLLTSRWIGPFGAWSVIGSTWAVLLSCRATRTALVRIHRRARVRHHWNRAVHAARIPSLTNLVPPARRVKDIPAGHRFDVRVPRGSSVLDLEKSSEILAAAMRVREVRVRRSADDASCAEVVVSRRDPLAAASLVVWPGAQINQATLWQPIPVGIGEDGEIVNIVLPERNLLLGGEPGAGKSVALSLMVATAALDPQAKLWLLDGKLVELSVWSRCAEGTAGVAVSEAIGVLRDLQAETDRRYAQLLGDRRRKVTQGDGLPLHVVVVDELAHYLTTSDRKERGEFADLLRDLVSRGRAAGIIVLAATQKPSSDVIPTSIRDLFGFRWAMRCSTPQASDTILGSGWATAGYSAADVDASARGVGYLLHEGGIPQRLRSYYLDDAALEVIAARAEARRGVAQRDDGV